MATVSVWAETGDIPGNVCRDARLRDDDGETIALFDSPRGQVGWQVGIRYENNLDLLASRLKNEIVPKHGKIRRLAIHAHGGPGAVFVNGTDNTPLTLDTLAQFRAAIAQIHDSLTPDAVVLFMGCVAAQNGDGLLMEVSRLLPGRKVVAFTTIGYAPGGAQMRPGADCSEPGMRVTKLPWSLKKGTKVQQDQEAEWNSMWNHLDLFPWADEYSPTAVIARNGNIIQQSSERPEAIEKREAAFDRIPRKPSKQQPKGQGPLPVMHELTLEEQLVYAVSDMSQPKGIDALTSETGLKRLQVEQAVRSLSGKMLIRWTRRGEEAGYVKFLDRYM